MNRKQFSILIVVGLLVGGLGLYLYNQRKGSYTASSFAEGQRVIKDFPLNDIAHLRILEPTNEVNLVRGDGGWSVKERYGYPANFTEISEFLRKVWELKPVQDVEAGPSQYGRLSLLNPAENKGTNSGVLVEFKDGKEATLKSMILGKKQTRESQAGPMGGGGEYPVGRYILVPGNPAKVWLTSETFANVETQPDRWINKDFFKIEKIKSVSVTSPDSSHNWTLSRESETGEWKLANASESEHFDPAKASSLNYLFSSPSFNDVAAPEAKIGETNLLAAAKIDTFENLIYTIQIGGKTNEDNLLLHMDVKGDFAMDRVVPSDEKPEEKENRDKEFKDKLEKLQEKLKNEQKFGKWTYQVSKYTVDTLLKQRKDFMAEKKEENKAEGAPSVSAPLTPPIQTIPDELKNILPPAPPEPQ